MDLKLLRKKTAPLVYLMQKILFRMTLFSFLLLAASVLLYVAGNFQLFLDSSQALVLQAIIFMAITLLFFAVVSIIFTVLDCALSKFFSWKSVVGLLFYVLCIILAVVFSAGASGLSILSGGVF